MSFRYAGMRFGECSYCHRVTRITRDHVIPLSRGGLDVASNRVPACEPCNTYKGSSLLAELPDDWPARALRKARVWFEEDR